MAENKSQNTGIQVLAPVVSSYVFAKPFKGDEAKAVYEEVKGRIERDFRNAPMFKQHFQFNEQTEEINGLNTYFGILIDNVLSQTGLWIPTIQEAKQLDASGRLSNSVYRDFGIAVYSEAQPNQEVAKRLIHEAERRGWELPVLAPFKALDLIKTGVKISFKKDAEGVIYGEEARQDLDKEFENRGSWGACRLGCSGSGSWVAGWDGLGDSVAGGRVDFVCGEATAKNLEASVLTNIRGLAQKEVESLNARIASAEEVALQTLRG